jgi:hypothetical protein
METKRAVTIKAPNMQVAEFEIKGISPLVIHRFSIKMLPNPDEPKPTNKRKTTDHPSTDDRFNDARYISKEGWDGFHAGAIRAAMISACRLANFKMTLARLSIFVIQDGWDVKENQVPLVRIFGNAVSKPGNLMSMPDQLTMIGLLRSGLDLTVISF